MQHPVQAVITVDNLLVTACNTTLTCFDLSTSTQISTSSPHSSLIRSLSFFTDSTTTTTTEQSYLISTGEDKQLIVSTLPTLQLVSQRELVKRANAIQVTDKGEIVVGDKFGDVYTFPLHPPTVAIEEATSVVEKKDSSPSSQKKPLPEHLPILGHVSMLNCLTLIPGGYIATGDRDEHVRISKFPEGHVIKGFLWGSKCFVSSLLYVPPSSNSSSSEFDGPLLLSAGGDSTIQIFSLNLQQQQQQQQSSTSTSASSASSASPGELIGKYEIESLLLDKVIVAPVLPDPVPAGRKKDKKGKNKSSITATTVTKASEKGQDGEEETVEEVEVEAEVVRGEEEEEKKELKTGLAVIKMLQIGDRETRDGGIVVLTAGSTALLYIPFTSFLSSSPSRQHSILSLPHPILDFTPLPTTTTSGDLEFLVSLDTTRSSSTTTTTTTTSSSTQLIRIGFDSKTQSLKELANPQVTLTSSSTVDAQQQQPPSISSLYPVLMMLHHPGDESDLLSIEQAEMPGDGKPKGGVRTSMKRTSSERQDGEGEGEEGEDDNSKSRKNGRRAVGRAETLRKWEEAKKKLESSTGAQ